MALAGSVTRAVARGRSLLWLFGALSSTVRNAVHAPLHERRSKSIRPKFVPWKQIKHGRHLLKGPVQGTLIRMREFYEARKKYESLVVNL